MADTQETVEPQGPDEGVDIQEELQVRLGQIREGLAEADRRTRGFVREHPVLSVCGAVAAGYLLGRIISRR